MQFDYKDIERELIEVGRSWTDELQHYLSESFGEEQANHIFNRYKNAFPAVYMSTFSPRAAVFDIRHLEQLLADNDLGMTFYRPVVEFSDSFRLKIYQHNKLY